MFLKWMTTFGVVGLVTSLANSAGAVTTIKIGTQAPQDSVWGREYKKVAAAVSAETNGELQVDYQFNGQAGDEVLMVQKMRSGQLDGAGITSTGLAQTGVTDVLIFQLPGMFKTWADLDTVRNALKMDLTKQFESKGFTVLGWGDVGAAKTMSVGFEIHRPTDLQGKGTFFLAGDPVQPKMFAAIGGMTPKVLTVNEILPGLTNGTVTYFPCPPLVAEQLQWASRFTHMGLRTVAFGIGALIVSTSRFQALPQKLRDIFVARSNEAVARLATSVRNLDAQSFERMKTTKKTYDVTEDERHEWAKVFTKVAESLKGTVFSTAMFDRVVSLAHPDFEH